MKTDDQLKLENPDLYKVAREGGTEAPHSSELLHISEDGVFHCAACNALLFSSDTKFDSGSGWPSFTNPIDKEAVILIHDTSHGMRRTEVRCRTCNAHLGHVFPDGPARLNENGIEEGVHDRYCINGISLEMKNK